MRLRLPLFRPALLLTALLTVSACQPTPEAAAPAAPAPAANTPAADATPAAATPATADASATPAAAPAPAEATPPGPIVPPQGPAPVAGKQYEQLPGGTPYQQVAGKIEVVEVFGYVCPACARFQPLVSAWKKKLPADVAFRYVPAPFGGEWIPYAKSFYVADAMGLVERSHDALIDAIHLKQTMPGEGDKPDEQKIADFYAAYGADPKQFLAQMNSFAIDAKVNGGKQFMIRTGVSSTPTLIINGKYRIANGQEYEEVLRVADHLIAQERAAMSGAAPAPASAATPAP